MIPIKDFPFHKGNAWEYISPVCSLACSIEYDYPSSAIHDRAIELTQSYFNQWMFVVNAYDKLQRAHFQLNAHSDKEKTAADISPYVATSILNENQFRDDAYLLLISMKTLLDLFACVADLVENKAIREEYEMPDLKNVDRKIKGNLDLLNEFARIRSKENYPFIDLVTEIRHKLIHRGYNLKPLFAFKKSEKLVIRAYKGTDIYTNVTEIDIGVLFDDFIRGLDEIEKNISSILKRNMNNIVPVEASITFDQGISVYNYKDTIARQ